MSPIASAVPSPTTESTAIVPIFKILSSPNETFPAAERTKSPDVALIVFPLILTLSTCKAVRVPTALIALCVAPVTVAALPVTLPAMALVTVKFVSVPTEVRDEFTTELPNVVAFNTFALFILNTLPELKFQS